MQFLIDEDLPRSVDKLFRHYGHKVIDVRDVGLRGAKDFQIISYAKQNRLCLITGDFDFSNIYSYPPSQYSGIVVLYIPKYATARFILDLLESFLKQDKLLLELVGKLAIVEPGRIRIRKD